MSIPAIIMLVLMAVGLTHAAAARKDFGVTLIATVLHAALLWWGGFFS